MLASRTRSDDARGHFVAPCSYQRLAPPSSLLFSIYGYIRPKSALLHSYYIRTVSLDLNVASCCQSTSFLSIYHNSITKPSCHQGLSSPHSTSTFSRWGLAVTHSRYNFVTVAVSLPKRPRNGRFNSERAFFSEAKPLPGSRSSLKYPQQLLETPQHNRNMYKLTPKTQLVLSYQGNLFWSRCYPRLPSRASLGYK